MTPYQQQTVKLWCNLFLAYLHWPLSYVKKWVSLYKTLNSLKTLMNTSILPLSLFTWNFIQVILIVSYTEFGNTTFVQLNLGHQVNLGKNPKMTIFSAIL